MPLPFDAAVKGLLEAYPLDWLAQLDMPCTPPVRVIDADLSTVTTQADKVFHIEGPPSWLAHLELQSSRDPQLARRVFKYNALLYERHGPPVHSVVVLLRREADHPDLTGTVRYEPPHGRGSLDFRYQVMRLWQRPVEAVLAGGLGTLPLAPLSDVAPEALPEVVRRIDQRLDREAVPAAAEDLWTATYVLMGLRYPSELATQLLQGVRSMRESSTYQAILAEGRNEGRNEGRAEEARKLLLLQGAKRFGAPADAPTRAALEAITDLSRLEELGARLLDVSSWQELLTAQ